MTNPFNLLQPSLSIIAGMPRAGTTYLYHALDEHPGAFVPYRKEIDFFSYNYSNGTKWYGELYRNRKQNQIAFDISPIYFFDHEALKRIAELDYPCKVVLSVRHPSDMAVSAYKTFLSVRFSNISFSEYLRGFTFVPIPTGPMVRLISGDISRMIEQYRKMLGNRLLIYSYDQFKQEQLRVLKLVETFFGLSSYWTAENIIRSKINEQRTGWHRLLSRITSLPLFISTVEAVFPPEIIRRVRKQVDRLYASSKKKMVPSAGHDTEILLDQARNALQKEDEFVERLFEGSWAIFGDSAPCVIAESV